MQTLYARDLMATKVTKIPPETPVAAVARMFADQGISTAAVTTPSGGLLGIITESDLIRRLASEDKQPRHGWLARMFMDSRQEAQLYIRSHGATAGAMMSAQVITVSPGETAFHVARLMEEHRIRRVLVVENEDIVGIVSRSDLIRALVMAQPSATDDQSDEAIRQAVMEAMQREAWADTTYTAVNVRNGSVEFHGFRRSTMESQALRVLAQNIPGVRHIEDNTRSLPGYFAS
jgi:CBS domain-containing protein